MGYATPLLTEEGWTRHQEEVAKPPLMERTGWSGMEPFLKNAFRNTSSTLTTINASPYRARASRPSAPAAVASHLFLDGAATPPISGGELPASRSSAPSMTARIPRKKRALTERPYKSFEPSFSTAC